MSRFVSPRELMNAACAAHLEGRLPKTEREWQLIANFLAFNMADGLEVAATRLICMIYDCPLPDAHIVEIAEFQQAAKRRKAKEKESHS